MRDRKRIRKGLVFEIIVVILASAIIYYIPVNVKATTYDDVYVDDDFHDGDDTDGDEYFQHIQPAIQAVNPGGYVYVHDGWYDERIEISKSIELCGESTFYTVIDGNGGGHVIHIKVSDVTVGNFTIFNSGIDYYGIYLFGQGTPITTVTDCNIQLNSIDSNGQGIYSGGMKTFGNTIYNNWIERNQKNGIFLNDEAPNRSKLRGILI